MTVRSVNNVNHVHCCLLYIVLGSHSTFPFSPLSPLINPNFMWSTLGGIPNVFGGLLLPPSLGRQSGGKWSGFHGYLWLFFLRKFLHYVREHHRADVRFLCVLDWGLPQYTHKHATLEVKNRKMYEDIHLSCMHKYITFMNFPKKTLSFNFTYSFFE